MIVRSTAVAVVAALTALSAWAAPAEAGSCPREGMLGVERVLPVEIPAEGLMVGTKSHPTTLPLGPREIVLTFDDGPSGLVTDAVLAALEVECVKATFFVVGQMAAAHPDQLRRMAAAGHTIAHHSMTHVIMNTVSHAQGLADVEKGWQTVDRILADGGTPQRPATPFFRYPGFARTKALDAVFTERRIGMFGADFWGSDWNPTTSEALLKQVLGRIEERGSGILLLHDIHAHTAAMVPALLSELKARGWKVVHIVPAERVARTK